MTGLKTELASAGPDGAATFSIPLPLSAGRGYAPTMSLRYHSYAGNGPFGIGWSLDLPVIRRRTRLGVPDYGDNDEFIGPDGDVLVPERLHGQPVQRESDTLLGENLSVRHSVTSWLSRLETTNSRIECWSPQTPDSAVFWVFYSPNGEISLFGRNHQARIDSGEQSRIAVWLLESSVSPTGEQIYYQYRAEDEVNCDAAETAAHPECTAQRYPAVVYYGNIRAGRKLPALLGTPTATDWLFIMALDYGERDPDLALPPAWQTPGEGNWLCRADCFSGYEYGFEIRTRRLCRQVLMFHRTSVLSATDSPESGVPSLVSCLKLDYTEDKAISTLTSVRQVAYEPDGTLCALPPLTFGWQSLSAPDALKWEARNDLGNMNSLQPYQMVDLNGEGMAGILYQDDGAWWYRAPVRATGGNPDTITWETGKRLSTIPALHENGMLIDVDGDGYLEWVVVSAPGVAGVYRRNAENEWQPFSPLSATPVEYAHPRMQLADIMGAGLVDMVLIGPESLRLYSGTGEGWEKAQNVLQRAGISLPVQGNDARLLVAFSDMAGSGQQQLVAIGAQRVRYWPNVGHGQFAEPITMTGFSQPTESFNPAQLYLADIDGSGTTDLIYALTDHLLIYLNQSGNSFATPMRVELPDGVRYDRTCQLQLADIQGQGSISLILTVPHPVPTHWVCHLSASKPWLLSTINNHMGARHTLYYRSSSQYWLDEKAEAAAEGKRSPVSKLPFALQTLQKMDIEDEITGNRLTTTIAYRHGAWDSREREFRGFGQLEVRDTDLTTSQGTQETISMPAVSRSWYATGTAEIDDRLNAEYWQGDSEAFLPFSPRFTRGSREEEMPFTPAENDNYWLTRGMKGILLRTELYGDDGSDRASVPYTVSEFRPQIRMVEPEGKYPVVRPMTIESRTYVYERVSVDPQCSQQIQLSSDEAGYSLQEANIYYPRRNQPANNPYPSTLPETLFASSYSEQQNQLILDVQHSSWNAWQDLTTGQWMFGAINSCRQNHFSHSAAVVPKDGLTLDYLQQNGWLMSDPLSATFTGQQQIWYLDNQLQPSTNAPSFPPRVAFTETAVLSEKMVVALDGDITESDLSQAGYLTSGYLFPQAWDEDETLWIARTGHTVYAPAEHFFVPLRWRNTLLTGEMVAERDKYDCVVTQLTDAAGLTTSAEYDWRFLTPSAIADANANVRTATMDALGRVTSIRFRGTEAGVMTGYSEQSITFAQTADEAINLSAPLPLFQCLTYVADSWMLTGNDQLPPHTVTITTDQYDSVPEQKIRQQIVFSDGFGRLLQTAVRQSSGPAFQRNEDGSLVMDETETDFRWAVSGKTEYDNKGQPVRTWQPYFLNSWKFVSNDAARNDLYSDTHYYDSTGRERLTETAKGSVRRTYYSPWFIVSEDENDTAADS